MLVETEYHRAALELLGVAIPAERMLPERAVDYPPSVIEWFLHGQLDALDRDGERLRVGPGFYVYLDEGDDPPVYHEDEGLVSLSFSNFAFDLAAAGRQRERHISASGPVPTAKRLEWLGEQLKPGPVTETEELVVHRFYGAHEYATVRWSPGGDAHWHLEADSEQALETLRETVDRAGGVPTRRGMLRRRRKR